MSGVAATSLWPSGGHLGHSWPVRVIVVGAGVVGLTCALRLAEEGYEPQVLARDLPLETTSAVAAALWYPYRAGPAEQVARWSRHSYDVFVRLAADHPASGVRLVPGIELFTDPAAPGPAWWGEPLPGQQDVAEPLPGRPWGRRMSLPVADTSAYLPWLVSRLEAAGGSVTRAWLSDLPAQGVVVNCTGLAARALADDLAVHPVRGQVVRVARDGIDEWLLDQADRHRPLYVVPREHDVVVGGTAEQDEWSVTPDPGTAKQILSRAAELVPALTRARVLGHRVGLRPARAQVRLETRPHPDGSPGGVVHCYGHGGSGVTLSWGCADDVVAAVATLLP